uniref:Uncharacterized protein n=1 Tax=Coccolithus braarudii TaxID=221442 RepID=A0A7S0LMA1_9EUKA
MPVPPVATPATHGGGGGDGVGMWLQTLTAEQAYAHLGLWNWQNEHDFNVHVPDLAAHTQSMVTWCSKPQLRPVWETSLVPRHLGLYIDDSDLLACVQLRYERCLQRPIHALAGKHRMAVDHIGVAPHVPLRFRIQVLSGIVWTVQQLGQTHEMDVAFSAHCLCE